MHDHPNKIVNIKLFGKEMLVVVHNISYPMLVLKIIIYLELFVCYVLLVSIY